MKRVLIDWAWHHHAQGGDLIRVEVAEFQLPKRYSVIDALAFTDLLNTYREMDPRGARVVEMRCFGGLTHKEIARVLKVNPKTVKRDWSDARTWLIAQLRKGTHASRAVGAS